MKRFNWSKIPAHILNERNSVWLEVLKMKDSVPLHYDIMESLFCEKVEKKSTKGGELTEAKAPTEMNLLSMKRSMNANIFLKQFKASHEEVVELIRNCDSSQIGAERLRGLQKIIPTPEEEEEVNKNYDGDLDKFGNAEKFYLLLTGLKGYKIRIDGMVVKDDFTLAMAALRANMDVIILACNKLMDNTSLKGFLRYVLQAGNFINAGGYAGNAAGFKIESLNKLVDTKSNKPWITLLHFLVEEAKKEHDQVLDFSNELSPTLTGACRFKVDDLKADAKRLTKDITQMKDQVENNEPDIKTQFSNFIQEAQSDNEAIENKLSEIGELSSQLANHFCEENPFELEECLKNFNIFCLKVKQCEKDNEQRKLQEQRAEKRRMEQEAIKARRGSVIVKSPVEEDGCMIDNLLNEVRKGFQLRKTRRKNSRMRRQIVSPTDS